MTHQPPAPPERGPRGLVARGELTLCRIAGVTPDGLGLLQVPWTSELLEAVSLLALSPEDAGRTVAVWFPEDHPPVVAGLVRQGTGLELSCGPDSLLIEGRRSLTLRCGEASLELHADGRVVLSGTELLGVAVGPIRWKGGSIELN